MVNRIGKLTQGLVATAATLLLQTGAAANYAYTNAGDVTGPVDEQWSTNAARSRSLQWMSEYEGYVANSFAESAGGRLRASTDFSGGFVPMTVDPAEAVAGVRGAIVIQAPGLGARAGFADFTVHYNWQQSHSLQEAKMTSQAWCCAIGLGRFAYDHGANLRLMVAGNQAWATEAYSFDAGRGLDARKVAMASFGRAEDQGSTVGTLKVRMPVIFNAPMSFELALSTYAHAINGFASVDASNSAYWGGMAVYDELLNPIDFIVNSDTSLEFRRSYLPVPEPGTYAMLAMGLLCIAVRCRRGRRPSGADAAR